ncbi:MAG TPA: phasin family protein [Micromonospora sp.]|nr:phasin family protein [Micromonospora sp.]
MQDAWRAYLELALGLTEASKKKAQQVARKIAGQGGSTAAQLQEMAEELLATSAANRESLAKLVRYEIDRALGVLGLATAEEVADLTERVSELERKLREAQTLAAVQASSTVADAGDSVGDTALAAALGEVAAEPRPPAKKTVAKKAVAKKSTPTKTGTAAASQKQAKKAVAKKTVAKKAVATKATKATVTKKTTGGAKGEGAGA